MHHCLDELSSDICLERCTMEDSLSRCKMHLVPVFILETNNQMNNECLLKFIETDNASSSNGHCWNVEGKYLNWEFILLLLCRLGGQ